ncbi:hypothetical protein Ari01nite_98990 [Paractinoplanes rishiriensis]|uniref:Uncharacterized protein n=1 Tax=Paractinoplanes rishiriensis TaxID=1050105 RepID=A0A919K9T8_9ACTN|nr:hypothetical protein Ari01nite_98990 [Actinoplanes rishiriensis]
MGITQTIGHLVVGALAPSKISLKSAILFKEREDCILDDAYEFQHVTFAIVGSFKWMKVSDKVAIMPDHRSGILVVDGHIKGMEYDLWAS